VFLAKNIKFNGTYLDSSNFNYQTYPLFGMSMDAFQPGDKIGIDRNPAAVPLLTYQTSGSPHSRPRPPVISDNRMIHLNGISMEFLEQLPDGSIKLKIRWDDNRIGRDVRWCGDIHLHEDLILEKKNNIFLDYGFTPQRPVDPVRLNGKNIFSEPSSITLDEGTGIIMQKKSNLILDNRSSLILKQGSQILLERGSKIIVRDSCSIFMHPEAEITGKGKIILYQDALADMKQESVEVRVKYLRK